MSSRGWQYLRAGAISAVLLAAVLWISGIRSIDLSAVRPIFLLPAIAVYVTVLLLRGAVFRALATGRGAPSPTRWVALAARHQLAFVLAPSGTGDLAFPTLARQMVGLGLGDGARVIAEARVRDLCVLGGLGCAGLVGTGTAPTPVLAGAVVAGILLYRSDLAGVAVDAALRRLRRRSKTQVPLSPRQGLARLRVALLPLSLWLVASIGVAMGFSAAGFPLGIYESWVMLAGLNVAGALAFSIAGFGVTEAGAAGILALLGLPLPQAAAIAIVARPLLLMSNVTACALLELVTRRGLRVAPVCRDPRS